MDAIKQMILLMSGSMVLFSLQGCGATGSPVTTQTTGHEAYGEAGDYDILIFARFWNGEPANETPCNSFAASHLTLHGVWPQYLVARGEDHMWPQYCNKSSYVASVMPKVASSFQTNWQKYAPAYPDRGEKKYQHLAQHEWEKHGTCWSSHINQIYPDKESDVESLQSDFFKLALELNEKFPTPQALIDASRANTTMSLHNLQDAFGGSEYVALQCFGIDHALSMVSLCFNKAADQQIKCPMSVLKEKYSNSCNLSSLKDINVAAPCAASRSSASSIAFLFA